MTTVYTVTCIQFSDDQVNVPLLIWKAVHVVFSHSSSNTMSLFNCSVALTVLLFALIMIFSSSSAFHSSQARMGPVYWCSYLRKRVDLPGEEVSYFHDQPEVFGRLNNTATVCEQGHSHCATLIYILPSISCCSQSLSWLFTVVTFPFWGFFKLNMNDRFACPVHNSHL